MSEEVAYVLITAFIIAPLLYLLAALMGVLRNAWILFTALTSLAF